jgi:hypothetical protein
MTFKEKYFVFKEKDISDKPVTMTVPQIYPDDIYVSSPQKMPFVVNAFIGGLSIVGLYIVYRFIEKSQKK